ncbi:unnamed protein product, partial [Didymodactylos carnosus]
MVRSLGRSSAFVTSRRPTNLQQQTRSVHMTESRETARAWAPDRAE